MCYKLCSKVKGPSQFSAFCTAITRPSSQTFRISDFRNTTEKESGAEVDEIRRELANCDPGVEVNKPARTIRPTFFITTKPLSFLSKYFSYLRILSFSLPVVVTRRPRDNLRESNYQFENQHIFKNCPP